VHILDAKGEMKRGLALEILMVDICVMIEQELDYFRALLKPHCKPLRPCVTEMGLT